MCTEISLVQSDFDIRQALGSIVARQAVAQRIASLQRGLDRRSQSIMESAFHSDATVDYGVFDGLATGFCELMGKDVGPGPVAFHRTANQWIKLDGEDQARSETYGIIYSPGLRGNRDGQSMIGGRYLDRHERRDGEWRMCYRQFVLDWNVNAPASGSALPDYTPPTPHGRRQADDPSFIFLFPAQSAAATIQSRSKRVNVSEELVRQAQVALAKAEIHDLLMVVARAIDRADLDLMRSVWTPDATVQASGFFCGAASDYCEQVIAASQAVKCMFHSLGNEWIRVDGDSAVAETYVTAVTSLETPEGNVDAISGGRYLDRFQLHEGRWKFSHRCFVSDWTMEHPSTDQRDDPNSFYDALKIHGGKYPDDPVYGFWSE